MPARPSALPDMHKGDVVFDFGLSGNPLFGEAWLSLLTTCLSQTCTRNQLTAILRAPEKTRLTPSPSSKDELGTEAWICHSVLSPNRSTCVCDQEADGSICLHPQSTVSPHSSNTSSTTPPKAHKRADPYPSSPPDQDKPAFTSNSTATRPSEPSNSIASSQLSTLVENTANNAKSPGQRAPSCKLIFSPNAPINVGLNTAGMPRRTWMYKYTTPGHTEEQERLNQEMANNLGFEFPNEFNRRWGGYRTKNTTAKTPKTPRTPKTGPDASATMPEAPRQTAEGKVETESVEQKTEDGTID
ncbi:hypothetical protein HDK77DRAFT_501926 [Phyllosticta capitalensis]